MNEGVAYAVSCALHAMCAGEIVVHGNNVTSLRVYCDTHRICRRQLQWRVSYMTPAALVIKELRGQLGSGRYNLRKRYPMKKFKPSIYHVKPHLPALYPLQPPLYSHNPLDSKCWACSGSRLSQSVHTFLTEIYSTANICNSNEL